MNVKDVIFSRRTIRKFKQEPVSNEQLKSYVNAARLAPSAANMQPLKYVAVSQKETCKKIFPSLKWAAYFKGAYTPKENEEPTAYIVVCLDTNIRKSFYEYDMGAAAENIILSALEDGVGSCWLYSVDREKLQKTLNLSENLEILGIIALGYPAESPKEVEIQNQDVKYYLEGETLCVPKRSIDEVLIEII